MMLQLTKFEQDRDALIAEILPVFKAHARIENTDEDAVLLPRYVGAAISAAENYLLRDIYPTLREWTGDATLNGSGPFVVRRGRVKNLTVTGADPAAYTLISSVDPKTWGFELRTTTALTGIVIAGEFGFASYAEMPDDLQAFILQAAGAFYEVREIANYGGGSAGVSSAAFLPLYLLDSWANLTYA